MTLIRQRFNVECCTLNADSAHRPLRKQCVEVKLQNAILYDL